MKTKKEILDILEIIEGALPSTIGKYEMMESLKEFVNAVKDGSK